MSMKKVPSINLAVGRSCFVKCVGCYNHFSKKTELVSNEAIINFLTYAKMRGIRSVTYCGGDPMSRPEIIDLLASTKRLGLTVKMDTVGTPLLGDSETIFFGRNHVKNVSAAEVATFVDQIGIPIDGSTEDVITEFRTGRGGLLAEQVEIVSLLVSHDCQVSVNTVVTAKNAKDLENIGALINNVSDQVEWEIFQYSPSGPISFKQRAQFEVEETWFRQKTRVVKEYMTDIGHRGRVTSLANSDRRNRYVLVDSEGEAWQPGYSLILEGDEIIEQPMKITLGNINDPYDHDAIISAVLSSRLGEQRVKKGVNQVQTYRLQ